MGWSQEDSRQRGTLRMLASCAVQVDDHEGHPSTTSPSSGRSTRSEGGLCDALLRRLKGQVCGAVSSPRAQEREWGAGGRQGHDRPAAAAADNNTVRGLCLLQTERCALAAAFTMIAKQRNNVQVRNEINNWPLPSCLTRRGYASFCSPHASCMVRGSIYTITAHKVAIY